MARYSECCGYLKCEIIFTVSVYLTSGEFTCGSIHKDKPLFTVHKFKANGAVSHDFLRILF